MDNDRIFAVSVLEGSHAGATLELPVGTYRFGRSRDADVVLTDPGLRPLHFSIDLAAHGASVVSMDGSVTLDGRRPVTSKNSARLRFPFEVAVDGVRLRVEGPESRGWDHLAVEWFNRGCDWIQHQPRGSLLAALAIIPVSMYALGAGGTPEEASAAHVAAPTQAALSVPVDEAVNLLRSRAKEAGLSSQLRIDPAGDAIAVRGTLMADQMAAWQGIRREFDAAHGSGYAFDTQIDTVSSMARPQLDLQAIWAGTPPYVITSSGERLKVGDRLTSGWKIEKIERSRVVLSQGDRQMTLTY